jgi:transcriptional regulator with XRE-family HTH domain
MLDQKIVGIKISSFRKKNHLSQEQLAGLLNISAQAISKWENGHSLPDTATLPVLSQIFNCTIDELIMPAYLLDSRIEEQKPDILEQQAEHIANCVLKKIEKVQTKGQVVGLKDQAIIGAIEKSNPNIGRYKIERTAEEEKPRYTNIYVTVSTPQKEFHLLERVYSGDDSELKAYQLFSQRTSSIPHIYHIDIPGRTLLMEDLNDDYIQGFHYDENSEKGGFIRENYRGLMETAEKWHADFWEDGSVFERIGLSWRHESPENLMAHLSGMEKDFAVYRAKEENKEIPRKWECFENTLDYSKLDYFQDAIQSLKQTYADLLSTRFHSGKNITVVHGDLHPGNIFIAKSPDREVKLIDLQAVRIGLCTEDLAMLLALHIEPDQKLAQPLIDFYYHCLTKRVNNYPYELFISDLKLSIMEAMFFPIRLINQGIYDFSMRDKAIKAYETFVISD